MEGKGNKESEKGGKYPSLSTQVTPGQVPHPPPFFFTYTQENDVCSHSTRNNYCSQGLVTTKF